MTIIITNDDGIDAPGIAALFKAVSLFITFDYLPVDS